MFFDIVFQCVLFPYCHFLSLSCSLIGIGTVSLHCLACSFFLQEVAWLTAFARFCILSFSCFLVTPFFPYLGKFGLEWRRGDFGSVHEGKERFRDVTCGVKFGWVGFESCHFAVCHFFTVVVVVVVGDVVEFFPGVILRDMTVVEVVAKFLPD